MISVVVVDDHPVVREGLVGMLAGEPDLVVVGTAADGEQAVVMVGELQPHVVLMDLQLPVLDGASATERITREHPQTHVLILTTFDSDNDIVRAVGAGASGYLLKDVPVAELVSAVRSAARGETVLAPPVAARLMTRMRARPAETLTPRETQVLGCVARGGTNAEIAAQLFIGEATVKTHLLRIFAKLQVDDRTHAVTIALERGLLR